MAAWVRVKEKSRNTVTLRTYCRVVDAGGPFLLYYQSPRPSLFCSDLFEAIWSENFWHSSPRHTACLYIVHCTQCTVYALMSNIVLAPSKVVIVEVGFTYTEEKAKDRVYSILAALATVFCTRTILRIGWIHLYLHILLVQFIIFFHIILVQNS